MATAEGVFPKVGNDPLYASEINKFNKNIQFLGAGGVGSTFYGNGFLGSRDTTIGSVLVSGISFTPTNPMVIDIDMVASSNYVSTVGYTPQISGLTMNNVSMTASNSIADVMKWRITIGSPDFWGSSLSNTAGNASTIQTSVFNNPENPFVIKFTTTPPNANGSYAARWFVTARCTS